MKPKIAVAFILKADKEDIAHFEKCLESIKGHVDAVFVNLNLGKTIPKNTTTKVKHTLRRHGFKNHEVYETKWTGNFVEARNFIFDKVPENYTHIMWLDADDTVQNPEKIREVCALMSPETSGLYIKYDYDHDEYGNVTVSHWVARIVRNNGSFFWKSSFSDAEVTVHETLNPKRKTNSAANDEFWIVHHADDKRRDASLQRNITLLEGMLNINERKHTYTTAPDPRILFYLATHYIDANRLQEAKDLFEWYLKLSGWAEERSQAWVYLGMIYDAMGDTEKARGCYMRGLAEAPNDPNPYVELGDLDMRDKLFDKAVVWLEMAVVKKVDIHSIVYRPMDNTYRAYKLLSQAYVNLGGKNLSKASKWLEKALLLRPFDPELHDARALLDELTEIRDLTKATSTLMNKLKRDKEDSKIAPFLDALPLKLQDNPLVASARGYYSEPKKWGTDSIAIICGWGPLGNWGPSGLDKGIGGSEEAVIRISRELAKMGYEVTIFGTPGEEAGGDPADPEFIRYKHYWEFNRKDTFDIIINWRNPEFFDTPVNARKRYLWLHDVMDKEEFTPERLENIDKLIFVSQYHRDLYPFIPEKKCFVSGNGISPEDFEAMDGKFERDPHRIIYMSSHVRGLELLYNVWDDVKKAVPDATLDIYYGWLSYVSVNKTNPERMAWMEMMQQREKELDGVTDHGKIGHKQIVEEIFKSGVWAYPCPFPEVYCITAVKAQAGGAVPVSSDFAALNETVQFGTKIHMNQQDEKTPVGDWAEGELDQFRDALIKELKHPTPEANRREMMDWARTQSWANTAKNWGEEFNGK